MTAAEAMANAAARLRAAGVPDPARDARLLLAHAAQVEAARVTLIAPEDIAPEIAERYDHLIALRAVRVPVSHLVGRRAFYGRDFRVSDAVLDPRALSVSKILTKLRRGRILSVQSLEDGTAEIAEGVTLDSSPLIGKQVDYAHLPDGVTAAALIRNGDVMFPSAETVIETDDRLFLFYETSATRKVEQFFRVSADFF